MQSLRRASTVTKMIAIWNEDVQANVLVPSWVNDLKSFRRWSDDPEFPEVGRITYFDGTVHVDMSKEQIFSHVGVKTEAARVLGGIAINKRGRYFSDGAYLTNQDADFSTKPDGLFVSLAALKSGRVRYVEGKLGGFVEVEGSPDMALEIVSDSSVHKDTDRMLELYWKAGIREYWLIDARGDKPTFVIYRHGADGYVPQRAERGWIQSKVFGHSFRLKRSTAADGHPEFQLQVR